MTNEKLDKLQEEFKALAKAYPQIQEMTEKIRILEEEKRGYEKLKKKYLENKKAKSVLAHELNNHLNALTNFPKILKKDETDEEKKYVLDIISIKAEIMTEIVGILSLDGMSRKELNKNAEFFTLEDLATAHVLSHNDDLKKAEIGLYLKYDRLAYNKPIKSFANKAAMHSGIGTILMNAYEHAPSLSTIIHAFRIDKEDMLETIVENEFSKEKLRKKGFNQGIGIPFVKDFVKKMCGSFEAYEGATKIQKDYQFGLGFGHKQARALEENTEIYGVKIKIPMSELTNSVEENSTTQ